MKDDSLSGMDSAKALSARGWAAQCTVWTIRVPGTAPEMLPPLGEFTASEAGVHGAIDSHRTDDEYKHAWVISEPAYVPRVHDEALHADVAAAVVGRLQALIVLRGTSSTGKTRSLWEAVRPLCPGWMVIHPLSAAALRGLPESGLLDRPCVVWLGELQRFLGPNGTGLSLDVLRNLFDSAAAPMVLAGDVRPGKLRDAVGEHRTRQRSQAWDLLSEPTPWVRWHDVARTLATPAELAVARELAGSDPRLAVALDDPDGVGFAQTLTSAHELLQHYRNAPTMARHLFDSAADAHRLGHRTGLSESQLRAGTRLAWRQERGAQLPPDGHKAAFDRALDYATQLLDTDGVRALMPVSDSDIGNGAAPATYRLAHHLGVYLPLSRATSPIPEGLRAALDE